MCHGYSEYDWLRVRMAADREQADESTDADWSPSFLNEDRDTDIEILTDGGTD